MYFITNVILGVSPIFQKITHIVKDSKMHLLLFLFIAVLLIAVFLLMPTPQDQAAEAAGLDDFQFPDNSNWRAIPVLYGTMWLHGNVLEYCCLTRRKIEACA
jgi:amino acid permease